MPGIKNIALYKHHCALIRTCVDKWQAKLRAFICVRSQSPENIRFNVNYHEVFIICKFELITKVTFVNLYPQIKRIYCETEN